MLVKGTAYGKVTEVQGTPLSQGGAQGHSSQGWEYSASTAPAAGAKKATSMPSPAFSSRLLPERTGATQPLLHSLMMSRGELGTVLDYGTGQVSRWSHAYPSLHVCVCMCACV